MMSNNKLNEGAEKEGEEEEEVEEKEEEHQLFTWLEVGGELFGDDDGEIGILTGMDGCDVGELGFGTSRGRPRDGDVSLL